MSEFLFLLVLVAAPSPDNGAPLRLATVVTTSRGIPYNIAVDDTNVYWTTSTNIIYKAPKQGGDPEAVVFPDPLVVLMLTNSTHVYWFGQTHYFDFDTYDSDDPVSMWEWFNSRMDHGELWRFAKTDGRPERFLENLPLGCKWAVDDRYVYWQAADGTVWRRSGFQAPEKVPTKEVPYFVHFERFGKSRWPVRVVADAKYYYWPDRANRKIMYKAKGSGSLPVALGTSEWQPAEVAIDDSHVYWISWQSSKIFKVPKP